MDRFNRINYWFQVYKFNNRVIFKFLRGTRLNPLKGVVSNNRKANNRNLLTEQQINQKSFNRTYKITELQNNRI